MCYIQVGVWSDDFNTINWVTYEVVASDTPFEITAGEHTVTVCIDAGDMNIDSFR
jgi:hypothetical protein